MYSGYESERKNLKFCPEPTYTFEVGDAVVIGNLKDALVEECLDGSKIYRISYLELTCKTPIEYTRRNAFFMWYDLRPCTSNTYADKESSFVKNSAIILNFRNCYIGELLIKVYKYGLDFEPDYQRELVWDLKDKQSLIDSIFRNVDIGKFALIDMGYHSKYGYEVLDGKQRITAIKEYFENRFPYNGKYFNDLSKLDQNHFRRFSVSLAITENTSREYILQYFLLLNKRGKDLGIEQLEKVEKLLQNELVK